MQQYALPVPPVDLIQSYFPVRQLRTAQQARRKAQTDTLVPLYPVLRQLVRFRKQLAERVLLACPEARRQVEAVETTLPTILRISNSSPTSTGRRRLSPKP